MVASSSDYSFEYKWAIIPSFVMPKDCYESYIQFFDAHGKHQDPVYIRVPIFTIILAFWCQIYGFMYNVNLLSKTNCKAMFLRKINYNLTQCYECLEAMCTTYFIIGHTIVW